MPGRFSGSNLGAVMEQKDAAVLFVDISGSTAFFDRWGEVAGREMVERCFRLLTPEVTRHGGRVVKTMGDGFLAVFPAALEVVESATAMHTRLADDNEARPDAARIRIHSGANVGPAIFDDGGDVYGDVVNVAARVQGVAGPDQIFVTVDVVNALPGAVRERTRRIGQFPLRGKGDEVELHEVLWKFDGATMVVSRAIVREESRLSLFFAGKVTELPPGGNQLTIGRIPASDLVVDDFAVSREHADVVRRKGSFFLVDHSTNGTHLRPALGRERHLHREEAPLEGSGEFSLGRPDGPAIEYKII